jgi:hypothetical protein
MPGDTRGTDWPSSRRWKKWTANRLHCAGTHNGYFWLSSMLNRSHLD